MLEEHVWVAPTGAVELWTGTIAAFGRRLQAGLHLGTRAAFEALGVAAQRQRIAEVRRQFEDLPF